MFAMSYRCCRRAACSVVGDLTCLQHLVVNNGVLSTRNNKRVQRYAACMHSSNGPLHMLNTGLHSSSPWRSSSCPPQVVDIILTRAVLVDAVRDCSGIASCQVTVGPFLCSTIVLVNMARLLETTPLRVAAKITLTSTCGQDAT